MADNNASAFDAEEYDNKIKQTLPYYEEFYAQITDVLAASGKSISSWLDVGCGTGKMYDFAKERIKPGKFVFCDNSPEMLQIAQTRFAGAGTLFWEQSVLELDSPPEFDVITAIQVNHYLNEKERKQSIKNCFHALKEGGCFFNFENFAPFGEDGKSLALERWKNYQIRQGKTKKEAEKHLARYGVGYHPITVTRHIEVLKECGFETVEIIWLSFLQVGLLAIKNH